MVHFQDVIKQAQEAQENGIELALYLDPYAENENDQFGYIPVNALHLFRHVIVVGYISQAGDVSLKNMIGA